MVNQGLASASNFGIAIYLVRSLDAASFGLWGIGFSIVLLSLGLVNGLLLAQMVVGLPHRAPSARPSYMRSILIGTLLLAGIFVALGATTATLIGWLTTAESGLGYASLASTTGFAASAAITLHYFLRQAFSIHRERIAVLLNLVLLVTLLLGVTLLEWQGITVTATLAMLIYGAAHLVAALAGAWLLPVYTRHWRLSLVRRDLADAWLQGRWAMAGVGVSWGQSQVYVFITPLFFGLAGLGAVNAARMIVAPLIMMLPAVNQIALPRFSALQANQPERVGGSGLRLAQVMLLLATGYSLVVWLGYDLLSQLLLGSVRADLFWIAMAWCLMACFSLIRQVATVIMQALRDFRGLFLFESAVLGLTVTCLFVMLPMLGLPGGVIATALGECLIAALVWRYLARQSILQRARPTVLQQSGQ
jgi:O-antigen/teichoic acid export membrane protein